MEIMHLLSDQHKAMKRSEIRELLKLTSVPGMISFGGGLPDPSLFPIEQIREVTNEVLLEDAVNALQYGTTEGDNGLRDILTKRYQKIGFNVTKEQLTIVSGSQQALDLVAKVFVNPGDKIICEAPSYLGSLGAFLSYGADIVDIPIDNEGMDFTCFKNEYARLKNEGTLPKYLYLIPDYQNPSGIHMSLQRRKDIVQFASDNNLLVIEDSPYKEFNFEGEALPSLFELSKTPNIVHFGTFSKTFMPGLRLGWIIADEKIIDRFVIAKQNTDLCTSPITQKIAAKFLEKGYFDQYLLTIKREYKIKRDEMLKAFAEFMPKEVTWNSPNGGLFLFIRFPESIDAEKLVIKAIERKVSYVPGKAFFVHGKGKTFARINFSYSSVEVNREGVRRLAGLLKEELGYSQN